MEDYTEKFDLEKLVGEMMQEIVILKSQNTALYAILKEFSSQQSFSPFLPEQFDELYRKAAAAALEHLKVSHSWYEGYWKHKLEGLLPPEP